MRQYMRPMRRNKRSAYFLGILFAVGALFTGCGGINPPLSPGQLPEEGMENPQGQETKGQEAKKQETGTLQSFSADTLDGGTFTQDEILEKDVTVINFWAIYCGPCITEMPALAGFAEALPENVQMVTVCLDGTGNEEIAEKILQEAGYTGVTLLDGDGDFRTLCGRIRYTPTTVFVDGEGKLWDKVIIGGQEDPSEAFLEQVNAILKEAEKEEISLEK